MYERNKQFRLIIMDTVLLSVKISDLSQSGALHFVQFDPTMTENCTFTHWKILLWKECRVY